MPRHGTTAGKSPRDVDIHVGRRLRERRILFGMSQERLGDAIGLTFQQVQKYERGTNRLGASRLWDVAQALDCPVSYFFEGLADAPSAPAGVAVPPPRARRELELMRIWTEIPSGRIKDALYTLIAMHAREATAGRIHDLPQDTAQAIIEAAGHGPVIKGSATGAPVRVPARCRVCGCTADNACLNDAGDPCAWAEPGLCTACVDGAPAAPGLE